VACFVALTVSFIFLREIVFEIFPRIGLAAKDAHKPYEKKSIPQAGGIAILVYEAIFILVHYIMTKEVAKEVLSLFLVTLIAGLIGFVDDKKKLNKIVKPVLTSLAALPLIFLKVTPSELFLPFGVRFNIPLIYLLLTIIAIPVTSNAINMFDIFNGMGTGTTIISSLGLFILKAILMIMKKQFLDFNLFIQLTFLVFPVLVLLYYYNRYPSKIFVGDTGTLAMGAMVGALSIIYRLEIAGVIFLLLPITNSFISLSIFGGLFERSELKERPIIVENDGTLKPNESKSALVTLTRIILLFGYKKEKEVIDFYMRINLILLIFGIVSYLLVM